MLKFGIFTHRNNEFQVDDIDDLFSFLCHILDIFTNRKDYIELLSLDSIAQKDEIIEDYTQNNPIQKAAYDIKYRVLNKRDWRNTASEAEIGGSNDTDEFRDSHIHSKIILEIMEVFHFLFDLRQNYLMANISEMFHKRVFEKNQGEVLFDNERKRAAAVKTMIRDFKKVLPDDKSFSPVLNYNFPSIDDMYDNEEFEKFRENIQRLGLGIDMHDNFLVLLVDTFNVSSGNKFLQQMTLTIICRYYSERSELIRNIDRMCLIFDEDEWRFYKWVNETIDQFTRDTEKSSLWMEDEEEFDEDEYIERVSNYLFELRASLNQKFEIIENEDGSLHFTFTPGERKINKFSQRVFRSLKVYDHLINFISQNKKLLIHVRT